MAIVLRILAVSTGDDSYMDLMGQQVFLKTFDVDAYEGRGDATWTADPRKAYQFSSAAEAMQTWTTQSTVKPIRDDGEPNRPLTAFTVELMNMEDPNDRHRI